MKTDEVVIVPFTLPWNHSADYQRQTCLELSRRGYRVIAYMADESRNIFNKSIKSQFENNVEFYYPTFILPLSRIGFIREINYRIDRFLLNLRFLNKKKIIWIFDPQFYNFFSNFFSKLSIYDCVDYQTSTTKNVDKSLRKMEKKLIENVDHFFVNSTVLKRIHQKNRKPTLVCQGVKINSFDHKITKRLQNKRPTIGYIGGINHRLDFKLLFFLTKNNPNWNFEFWGPLQYDEQDSKLHTQKKIKLLKKIPNIYWNFSQDRKELSRAISNFDVGIIPYDINQKINLYSFPMKTFEYQLFGIPTISTNILELKNPEFKRLIAFGENWREFEIEIKKFLQMPLTISEKLKAKNLAKKHSWKNKIGQILFVINKSKKIKYSQFF